MSKRITTTNAQSLNELYHKFLKSYILHHLPSSAKNQVSALLNMTSAVQCHQFLQDLLTESGSYTNDLKQNLDGVKSNGSGKGFAYQDDFKYPYDHSGQLNQKKTSPAVKRTNTYADSKGDGETSEKFLEDIKGLGLRDFQYNGRSQSKNKEYGNRDDKANTFSNSKTGSQHNQNSHAATRQQQQREHNNIVKHDYDTISEKKDKEMESVKKDESGHRNQPQIQTLKEAELSSSSRNYQPKSQPQEPLSAGMYKRGDYSQGYVVGKQKLHHIHDEKLSENNSSCKDLDQRESQNKSSREHISSNRSVRPEGKIRAAVQKLRQTFRENQRRAEQYQTISNQQIGRNDRSSGSKQNSANLISSTGNQNATYYAATNVAFATSSGKKY